MYLRRYTCHCQDTLADPVWPHQRHQSLLMDILDEFVHADLSALKLLRQRRQTSASQKSLRTYIVHISIHN